MGTRHCGRVGTHHRGVRSDFRCLESHLKKKRAIFKFSFFAKNAPKCAKKYFCVSGHYRNLKTYLDTKFQLIWPSNEARASKWAFFFPKVIFFWPKSGSFILFFIF